MNFENDQFSTLYLGKHRINVRFAFNIITKWGFLLRPLESALSGKLIRKAFF